METQNKKTLIEESIFGDLYCKGGKALIIGVIKQETEKAIRIEYGVTPIFASGCSNTVDVRSSAWIPKSQVVEKPIEGTAHTTFEIKAWFINNCMKSFGIKPYTI